ncbi:MAG: transglutaminase family protein [Phycisphaerae bacterium]
MLVQVSHITELDYSTLISETVMELRMAPRQERLQHRLSFILGVGPAAQVHSYFDWLGNTVHTFAINNLHRNVKISATSVVQTYGRERILRHPEDMWPLPPPTDHTLFDMLRLEYPVVDCPALTELANSLKPRGHESLARVALNIMDKINDDFVYEKGITSALSAIAEVLEHKRGVCQDFTHLMIGLARKLNIPARYVSGFIHAGNQQFRGAAQTHAWCELYFPSVGWIGYDPTNNCEVKDNFVKMAVGRHYNDVPPHKGVYRGNASETMKVAVHTMDLPEISGNLVGERTDPLNVPVFGTTGRGGVVPWILEEQVQQQQQQQQGAKISCS